MALFFSDSDRFAGASTTVWLRHVFRLAALVLALVLPHVPRFAAGQEVVLENRYRVEAAFIRNFARYVTWPDHVFAENNLPWRIGILGQDPFGEFMESTFKGRMERGRSFEIFRADTLDELPACQIIFIAYKDAAQRRALLDELKDKPVLTVGEAPDFLNEGGIIRFQVGDRVRMSINLDQARSASLGIQTKMLEVSDQILENGVVRRLR